MGTLSARCIPMSDVKSRSGMRNTFGDWQKEASIDERVWEPGTRDGVGAGPARQTTTQVWLSLDPCTPKTSPKSLGRPWVLAPLLPCLRLWVCVQTGAAAQGGCLKSSSPSLCSCCVSGASAKVLQSGCLVGLVLAAIGVSGVVCVCVCVPWPAHEALQSKEWNATFRPVSTGRRHHPWERAAS